MKSPSNSTGYVNQIFQLSQSERPNGGRIYQFIIIIIIINFFL